MIKSRWFLHPVSIFISSLLALGLSLFLYIHWYLSARDAFTNLVLRYNVDARQFGTLDTWVIILVMSVLVTFILISILLIFIYYQKMIALYRQQQNFINGFTHELKTPLTSLRLYLDTFRIYELGRQDQLKYLDLMINDVVRLGSNVEGILDLAKLESGAMNKDIVPLQIMERIEQIVENQRNLHMGSNIKLSALQSSTDKTYVRMAAKHLEVILSNLIKNGLIHNRSLQPMVEISVIKTKRWVSISVIDNGIGIEKKEQKKIFRKFYQVGNASKGTGIGLYVVTQIVRLYGGKINLHSEGIGKGSRFEVLLPVSK